MRALLFLSAILLAPLAASATTYNAVNDFSSANNPSGVWSYGYGTPGSTFTLDQNSGISYAGISGDKYWTGGGVNPSNIAPLIAINPSGMPYSTATTLPADELWMHPGNASDLASILQFTAPAAGTYTLSGLWERLDDGGGNGVFVSIYEGSTALMPSTYIIPTTGTSGTTIGFDLTANLLAGQTVDFDLAPNGQYNDDSTGLKLNVSSTPEPSSLILLGTGLAAFAGAARRRLSAR